MVKILFLYSEARNIAVNKSVCGIFYGLVWYKKGREIDKTVININVYSFILIT